PPAAAGASSVGPTIRMPTLKCRCACMRPAATRSPTCVTSQPRAISGSTTSAALPPSVTQRMLPGCMAKDQGLLERHRQPDGQLDVGGVAGEACTQADVDNGLVAVAVRIAQWQRCQLRASR